MHERPAVLWQFPAQQFHNVRPRRDRVTSAKSNSGCNKAIAQRLVAIHYHLLAGFFLTFQELKRLNDLPQRMRIAGVESIQGIRQHARIFAGEPFLNQLFQFWDVQIEHLGNQAERKNVLSLIFGRSADGLDGQPRNRHANMMVAPLPFRLRFDMIGVI